MEQIIHFFIRRGCWLFAVRIAVWVMLILSLVAITLTLVYECFPLPLDLSSQGMANFVGMFKPFYPLFSGTIMVITIYVALSSYVQSKKVEATNALQKLRNMLMTDDNMRIHELLEYDEENSDEKENKINDFEREFSNRQGCVYNYLGILELSKFYLDEGIIKKEQLKDQFGYRVTNAFANPLIYKWIKEDSSKWQTLYDLKKIVEE